MGATTEGIRPKIGFVGFGSMASAMADGLIRSGRVAGTSASRRAPTRAG